jgi:UDP-N-acetylglucosamine/UDP-N-acetylgalactosamine diphosphorylase
MTSGMNDKATRDYFEKNEYFNLVPESVFFFAQGTMPAVDYKGKILLEAKSSLALSPDGHGGTLLALRKSQALKEMRESGIEYISYFQVDNPLVSIIDPLFVGLHCLEKAEASARMLPKTGPYEKLGNFCVVNGRLQIIEYSDMPSSLAEARDSAGKLKFISGSPAIHVFSRDFIEKLTEGGTLELPWHRADKKVSYVDVNGDFVKPSEPNAVKLESFIFDALPLAKKTVVLEARRDEEFAPTKNPTGVDSVESCREMLIARDAARLKEAGADIPLDENGKPDCILEISPEIIIDKDDARAYVRGNNISVKPGDEVYIGK